MPGILVGIDGSKHSLRALEWAIHEAALREAPLTVLTVCQAVAGYMTPAVAYPGDETLAADARKMAQEQTDELLGEAESKPPAVQVLAVVGLPADEILQAGEDADMIVLGSRGAGGFRRLLMGSVSSQVAHHAHSPVVIIPQPRS